MLTNLPKGPNEKGKILCKTVNQLSKKNLRKESD
jgi:hypothetical protein